MRLQVMRRTMQAMADMDLEVAERLMAIAEAMAETHPRKLLTQDVDELAAELFEITRRSAPKNGAGQAEVTSQLVIGGYHMPPFTTVSALPYAHV